jgi:Carboxypeptidase regulatory-like domain
MKRLSLLLAFLLLNVVAFGQAAGWIEGKVTDEDGKGLQGAAVVVSQGGTQVKDIRTNAQGRYTLKPLDGGSYTLRVTLSEREPQNRDVDVQLGSGSEVNITLGKKTASVGEIITRGKKKDKPPFIQITTAGPPVINAKQAERLPTTNIGDAVTLRANVYQAKSGSGISMGGGRGSGTGTIIDGQRVSGTLGLAYGSVQAVSVDIGGLPANLGDASGGFQRFTTKTFTTKTTGSFMYQRSIDGYNNNTFSFNLRGPLYKKKLGEGRTATKVGYSLAIGGNYDKDGDPGYYNSLKPKDDVMAAIAANPLKGLNVEGRTIFYNAADFLRRSDFEEVRQRRNAASQGLNANGNIVFLLPNNINLKIGGNGSIGSSRNWGFGNSLFATDANSNSINSTVRGLVRFQQTLSKENKNEDGTKSLIGNAYYVIQANYERNQGLTQHATHKDRIFDYGYLGKFNINSFEFYRYDTTRGGFKGIKFQGNVPFGVQFTSNDAYNPQMSQYTKQFFNNTPFVSSLDQILVSGGLRNGDAPSSVHGGYFSGYGSAIGSYNKSLSEQYSLNFDASFDINTGEKKAKATGKDVASTHSMEFGLYYEQRTNRSYGIAARGLWPLMRVLANNDIEEFDFQNPYWLIGGSRYSYAQVAAGDVVISDADTIRFERLKLKDRSQFSSALRSKLGLDPNGTEYLNIDGYDPTNYSIDMFSADDLNGQGSQYVAYSGYDHKGNFSRTRASFEDFWRQTDAETGKFTRPIAPYNPIYVAGYLQDNFKFKDIRFRLGVRIDRFDGNQKVMRDPYSLFASRKVSDLAANSYKLITNSSNISAPDPVKNADFKERFSNAAVYVNENKATGGNPTIVGYRIGEQWYDPFGAEVANPEALKAYTGGVSAAPYLVNAKDGRATLQSKDFDINSSFTDYKPRVAVSPRISFIFPVETGKSQFYAHYDVVTQRPGAGNSYVTPDDYYYINERAGGVINNANLNYERLVDYELGFTQVLNPSSAITISGFYKERKDQMQLMNIVNAYPLQYQTFGNRDFSTAKGMTALYDLRPDGAAAVNLNVAYTLQFAEGTGSSSTSQRSLLASGQPNLRTVLPLDFDSRHNLSANLDYRYGQITSGEKADAGPKVGKYNPFRGMGVNVLFKARSGEPYTKLARATPLIGGDFNSSLIVGTVNGSRRPWTFNTDVRLDRDIIIFGKGKKNADGTRAVGKAFNLNAYLIVQNVFNTRNVLGVFPFTGQADNDGYLQSPIGQQALTQIVTSKESFQDYYAMYFRSPSQFVNPRRAWLGINFGF